MNISNLARIRKLLINLASNPDLILPYLLKSLLNKKLPISHELPWWSFRAIDYADRICSGKRIFEFGTGGSTIRYARVCESLTCVEDNDYWLKVVEAKLNAAHLSNVRLIYRYFDFHHSESFCRSEYLRSYEGSQDYDVIIIDGADITFRERITCFKYVEPTIKAGGTIILDDWWRYVELLESNRAKKIEIFESVGPCRYGVTSTAFFHY